jgi:hypothetical protein
MSPVSIPWRCAESARRWRPEDRGPRPLAARPPHARPPTPRNRKGSRGCQVQVVTFQIFRRQFLECSLRIGLEMPPRTAGLSLLITAVVETNLDGRHMPRAPQSKGCGL